MFQHLVIPLDGSPLAETALVPACALARRFEAHLVLVSACAASEVAERSTYLADLVDRLSAEGFSVRAIMPPAPPAEGIRSELAFVPAALIVMTTHGRTGLDALLHPSVTWDLFTQAPAPLLVCTCGERAQAAPHVQVPRFLTDQTAPILVPLDSSLLAEQALSLAQELARGCGNPLVLLRAVEPVLVGFAWEEAAPEALVEAESYLKRKQAELSKAGLRVEHKSGLGLAPALILEGAQQYQAGLIVIGSHGRGRLGRLVLGSVARSVLRQAEVPVLLVRGVTPEQDPPSVREEVETPPS